MILPLKSPRCCIHWAPALRGEAPALRKVRSIVQEQESQPCITCCVIPGCEESALLEPSTCRDCTVRWGSHAFSQWGDRAPLHRDGLEVSASRHCFSPGWQWASRGTAGRAQSRGPADGGGSGGSDGPTGWGLRAGQGMLSHSCTPTWL